MAAFQVPTSYTAAVVVRDGENLRFESKQIPTPELSPDEILVKLSATGVCGTDFALASGKLGPACDVLGHEGVGYVVKLGAAVSPTEVEVGYRVGISWLRDICNKCPYCLAGDEPRCVEQMNSGRKIPGTFAEYAVVPARYVVRIADNMHLSEEQIAPILCGGVTAYKALKLCGARAGQWVVVSGAGGGVGALAVQYARVMGFRVIGIDAGEEKRRIANQLGVEIYIDALQSTDSAAEVRRVTGSLGATAVIVAAGVGKAYQAGLECLGPFGTLVCVGIPPPDQLVNFHPLLFIDKGIKIIGSAVGTRADISEALDFVHRGLVNPSVRTAKLEDLNDILKTFGQNPEKWVLKF